MPSRLGVPTCLTWGQKYLACFGPPRQKFIWLGVVAWFLVTFTELNDRRIPSWQPGLSDERPVSSKCSLHCKNIRISTDIYWRVATWARASLVRRFTDTNVYPTGSVNTENSPQNIRGYTDIFYSVGRTEAHQAMHKLRYGLPAW